MSEKKPIQHHRLLAAGVLALAALFVLAFMGAALFCLFTSYHPSAVVELFAQNQRQPQPLERKTPYRLVSWDIGYAGLDREQSLWREGGSLRTVTPTGLERNLVAITSFLATGRYDFMFLRQVDRNAARSFGVDQTAVLSELFAAHESVFAYDLKVRFAPLPNLWGRAESGLMTFSAAGSQAAERRRLVHGGLLSLDPFGYDYCLTLLRVPVSGGGMLTLINAGLPASEKERGAALSVLEQILADELAAGHDVICAGGWGGALPSESFTPAGYRWVTGGDTPTARSLDKPYVYGENALSIEDGFLTTESVNIEQAVTAGLEFQNAAHNPLELLFELT